MLTGTALMNELVDELNELKLSTMAANLDDLYHRPGFLEMDRLTLIAELIGPQFQEKVSTTLKNRLTAAHLKGSPEELADCVDSDKREYLPAGITEVLFSLDFIERGYNLCILGESDPIQQGSDRLSNQGYDIVFDHVGFAYNTGETVLKDVSFTAKQGEVTALVGPSGGGKTTVSRLAARFWDINRGKITVGGMDVSRIDPETLLSLYSIVFQDVTLFDNTILENIRIGNKDATDEQVIAAAKLANVDEFVKKLPDGWHTNIGENGCELSGGERQRISIARAFLKNAPIILLDEATASLDVENETLIQTALSRLIADKTVLVIAHRMRTVAGADKIVVLSDGTVAEEGSPNDLEEKNGVYAHMVKLQTESQNWKLA